MNKYLNSKKKDDFIDFIKKKDLYLKIIKDDKPISGAFIKK